MTSTQNLTAALWRKFDEVLRIRCPIIAERSHPEQRGVRIQPELRPELRCSGAAKNRTRLVEREQAPVLRQRTGLGFGRRPTSSSVVTGIWLRKISDELRIVIELDGRQLGLLIDGRDRQILVPEKGDDWLKRLKPCIRQWPRRADQLTARTEPLTTQAGHDSVVGVVDRVGSCEEQSYEEGPSPGCCAIYMDPSLPCCCSSTENERGKASAMGRDSSEFGRQCRDGRREFERRRSGE
jgi:hypothetical protein